MILKDSLNVQGSIVSVSHGVKARPHMSTGIRKQSEKNNHSLMLTNVDKFRPMDYF